MLCNNKYPENAKSKSLLPNSIRRINGVEMNTSQYISTKAPYEKAARVKLAESSDIRLVRVDEMDDYS